MAGEALPGGLVDADGQLEGQRRPAPRQVEEPLEFAVLGPVVALALVGDVLALVVPGGDRRVGRAGWRVGVPPQVHQHRLAGRHPGVGRRRDAAVRLADVLAEGEVRVVGVERGDGAGLAVGHLHLRGERIGLHVDPPRDAQQIVVHLLRAGDVEQGVGLAVERVDPGPGHAVALPVGIAAPECPAVGQPVRLEHRDDRGDVGGGVG